jgi:hypothetical protein
MMQSQTPPVQPDPVDFSGVPELMVHEISLFGDFFTTFQLFEASFCASSSQSICAQLRREIPATPKWEPHAFFLIWNDGSQVLNKVPSFIEYVSTREDAERYGLTFARKWIDDGKPPLGDHLVPISKRL